MRRSEPLKRAVTILRLIGSLLKYIVIYKGEARINETILGISGTDITQSQKLLAKLLKEAGFDVIIEKIGTLLVITGRISNKT